MTAPVAADIEGQAVQPASAKLTLVPLIALVIGSMIGGGVFNLPSDMSFLLALIPFGPLLIWGPAAGWLYLDGEIGWAVFIAIWSIAAGLVTDTS